MSEAPKTEADHIATTRDAVLDIAILNAVFDGWGEGALREAVREAQVDPGLAKLAFPRGAVDLALAFHRRGDTALAARMASDEMQGLRYSQKVARALELRIDVMADQRDAVRKAAAFFALPQNAADGARAVWETADTIWKGLGDSSQDYNWYTKRATLSAVWSSVVLYWLGDDSPDHARTLDFIERRIDNVMAFEKVKSQIRDTPMGRAFAAGPGRMLERIKAPTGPRRDLPGYVER
ncbi:MAG: COQ9 family protein [Pseudomonadota bacterium]